MSTVIVGGECRVPSELIESGEWQIALEAALYCVWCSANQSEPFTVGLEPVELRTSGRVEESGLAAADADQASCVGVYPSCQSPDAVSIGSSILAST